MVVKGAQERMFYPAGPTACVLKVAGLLPVDLIC
jgi:hypothetical protein